jgi:putative drug exporter of the RND superfamily
MSRKGPGSKKPDRLPALGRIGGLLTRRARLVVGVWAVFMAVLALQGLGLGEKLSVHPIYIDGTITQQEHEISLREFGSEDALVVMLRGPRTAVESQGRRLADRLEAIPRSLVVTPWTPGAAIDGLRPRPGVVALLISLEHRRSENLSDVAVDVQREVDAAVSPPVRVSVAGAPALASSLQEALQHATTLGELLAIPILLVVLLLVFRSVLAAAIPVIIGGTVVAATRGVVSLLLGVVEIDSFALGAVGMMGLALGVDYSLLVISRYREEVQKSGDVEEAVRITVMATGRSVIPAASGLVLAMVVASQVVPGAIANSVSIAIIIATVLSAFSAIFITPSFLMLLGPRLDRWSLPQRRRSSRAKRRSRWLASRPWVAWPAILILVLCAGWSFTLDTGLASFSLLPEGDSGRRQNEDVQRALGPGWTSPMEIVMDGGGAPVTTPRRLRALADFQRRVERDPGVQTMAGFAAFEEGTEQLGGFEQALIDQEHGLVRLDRGLSRAHAGAARNTTGLLAAADGARQLDAGVGATHTGAGLLADGLGAASDGSDHLSTGLGKASDGSGRLAQGAAKASTGLGHLADALSKAEEKSGETAGSARLIRNAMKSGDRGLAELSGPLETTEAQLAAARQALVQMSDGRVDPEYVVALQAIEEASKSLTGTDPQTGERTDSGYDGIGDGVERAEGQFDLGSYLATKVDQSARQGHRGTRKLARLSARLDRGVRRLATASRQISGGIAQLARGGEKLSPGLQRLSQGADHLLIGLGALQSGAGGLASGLGAGAQKSKLLTGGLHRIDSGLERQRGDGSGGTQLERLRERSPGLFRSGYFYLAGIDGGDAEQRQQAGFLVNLDRGGHAARMLVIPSDEPATAGAVATTERLQDDADELGRSTGTRVLVGGFSPSEHDVNTAIRDQAPLTRLALSIVTFLILLPVVRSLALPLLAALINVLTVGATFGLLSLLFNDSLLGGPGYVDTTVLPATMIVIFGLAIDYEVFIFARMREEYVRTGSPSLAITNGLKRTGHVVTGAALIMIAVFLAFTVSSFVTLRDFGVAQAIAVFIDAFIVRLVVVPSLMRMMGKWSWWMPRWLDRLLPGGAPVTAGLAKGADS